MQINSFEVKKSNVTIKCYPHKEGGEKVQDEWLIFDFELTLLTMTLNIHHLNTTKWNWLNKLLRLRLTTSTFRFHVSTTTLNKLKIDPIHVRIQDFQNERPSTRWQSMTFSWQLCFENWINYMYCVFKLDSRFDGNVLHFRVNSQGSRMVGQKQQMRIY